MSRYSLSHLADGRLFQELPHIAAVDRATTADLLAHLAEVEVRGLFAVAGYSSMFAYCTEHLKYSDAAAHKRITACRVAHDHPVLFDMVVDGRMSLTTIIALSAKLPTPDAAGLIEECAGKSRSEIEWILAKRFPKPEMFEWGTSSESGAQQAPDNSVNGIAPGRLVPSESQESGSIAAPAKPDARLTPLSEDRVALQVTISRATQQKLERAKELLGYEVAAGDAAALLDRALDALIVELEKKKYGKHTKHRAESAPESADPHYIPSAIREEVAKRDGEQCAFVSDDGKRCESRHALEFDHIVPVTKGGATNADNLRLICHAHNQLEADRKLGKQFMNSKRRPKASPKPEPKPVLKFPFEDDLRAALTTLQYTRAEISIGLCASARLAPEATCEQRMKAALEALRTPHAKKLAFAKAPASGAPA
ncbi:MAG: HNH endonuclease [Candidatus Eisenbacteria bacterium]|nr:HNH endonuclease [Candidatus Eisenbacteria bacterium]